MNPHTSARRKQLGAYYTPDYVVRSLVRWVIRRDTDRMLDPSCGDGRFLAAYSNSFGVDPDPSVRPIVRQCAPHAAFHQGDFFLWARSARKRFDCAAGNPPFIRYQRFVGPVRDEALSLCRDHGVVFSSLTSSWAPFLIATATLLKPGGRMAFVVPSEIGHKPYAAPVLEFMARRFDRVQIVAVQRKLFPDLSEDCWLLYADGYGGCTDHFELAPLTAFGYMASPPSLTIRVDVAEWRRWNARLRPFLMDARVRELYASLAASDDAMRLGDIARVGIGYVTGANDFFHLRPSEAKQRRILGRFLRATVRNGKALSGRAITPAKVDAWIRRDQPILLLSLSRDDILPAPVRDYLDTPAGEEARETYKCRNRSPWYSVPDVTEPNAFLSYMSGETPSLVANRARCVCTNSVHAVRLTNGISVSRLQNWWRHPFTTLSCEIEGHPLGGGLLKLEPREASKVLLCTNLDRLRGNAATVRDGIKTLRRWRHYG